MDLSAEPRAATAEPELAATPVSVIVPVRDDAAGLRTCVAALLAQDHPALEIVVVDNGSAIPVAGSLPSDGRIRVVDEPRAGSYTARNAGLAVCTGQIVAFTDADCTPRPDWVSAGVRALSAPPGADLVGGAIRLTYRRDRPASGPEWYEHQHAFRQDRTLAERGYAVTANLMTWRAVIDRVGGFEDSVYSGADARWCRAVRRAGGVLRYSPDAVVSHPARAGWRGLLRKHRRTTLGVLARLREERRGPVHLLRLIAGQLGRAAITSVRVWWAPEPASARDRLSYLAACWAVAGTVSGVLVGGLRREPR